MSTKGLAVWRLVVPPGSPRCGTARAHTALGSSLRPVRAASGPLHYQHGESGCVGALEGAEALRPLLGRAQSGDAEQRRAAHLPATRRSERAALSRPSFSAQSRPPPRGPPTGREGETGLGGAADGDACAPPPHAFPKTEPSSQLTQRIVTHHPGAFRCSLSCLASSLLCTRSPFASAILTGDAALTMKNGQSNKTARAGARARRMQQQTERRLCSNTPLPRDRPPPPGCC